MEYKDPPFRITDDILILTSSIAETVGRLSVAGKETPPLLLRRENRIRSIYSSLAIERNSLTLDQVTAVLEGKRVLGPPKDIKEVQNAYEIYDRLETLDPYSVDDLLSAHNIMTRDLVPESGMFRTRPVGVVDRSGNIIHFGTLPAQIPALINGLLAWTRDSSLPILIKSCVFHYEFELIHPFSDGNGRVGRLWHSLLLSRWNRLFAWLPIESIIHDRQEEYYRAFNESNDAGESTAFIRFMLSAIEDALEETLENDLLPGEREEHRWKRIRSFLLSHPNIRNSDIRSMFDVSAATANRILSSFCASGMLRRIRDGKTWAYEIDTGEE
ncbi:MAG: Fic family protein [Erysipelotrichaceae bacterium]|nr:Fic family protein [Erysipelotrichaceae bacterium]